MKTSYIFDSSSNLDTGLNLDRKCLNCNKEFKILKILAQRILRNDPYVKNRGKYCSRECQNKGRKNGQEKTCFYCEKTFYIRLSKVDIRKYCSSSCSTTVNNQKRLQKSKLCLECNLPITSRKSIAKYCSSKCSSKIREQKTIEGWLKGEIKGYTTDGSTKYFVRKYIKSIRGEACELCGWLGYNRKSGLSATEIDHIDGDYTNNDLKNLRVLCPNCHSLCETHRALNKGKGRGRKGRKN